jgi:hypothetical protein
MSDTPPTHHHWLCGDVKLNVPVLKETRCKDCIHIKVCDHSKPMRCSNYDMGTSDHREPCDGCIHRYTRAIWVNDGFPCFHCESYSNDDQKRIEKVIGELERRKDDKSYKAISKWEGKNMAPIKLYWQTLEEVIELLRGDDKNTNQIRKQTALETCDNMLEELHDIIKDHSESEDYRLVEAIVDLHSRVLLWKERSDVR